MTSYSHMGQAPDKFRTSHIEVIKPQESLVKTSGQDSGQEIGQVVRTSFILISIITAKWLFNYSYRPDNLVRTNYQAGRTDNPPPLGGVSGPDVLSMIKKEDPLWFQ